MKNGFVEEKLLITEIWDLGQQDEEQYQSFQVKFVNRIEFICCWQRHTLSILILYLWYHFIVGLKCKRKSRTIYTQKEKDFLESVFQKNMRPTINDVAVIAQVIKQDLDTIRIWFYNRRQKEKRIQWIIIGENWSHKITFEEI